jgi:hypothetical protein
MILFALALLATSPTDAAAATTAPTPTPASTPAPTKVDDLDRMVCHVDAETGTRLGTHKECHTKREWIQMQSQTATDLDRSTTRH